MPTRTLENYRNHNRMIRENYRRNPQMTAEAQQDAIALMLTEYGMNEASLQEKSTVRKVQESWNRRYDTYRALSAEFCASMTPQELNEVMRSEDGGRRLAVNFRKFLAARDRIPEGVADSLRPTAAGRIQYLKNRISRGDFQTPVARRRVMAEILAARESVGARRSGKIFLDANLSNRISDDVSVRAAEIEQELQNVPEETLNRLYQGLSGRTYGGAMQEQLEPLRKSEVKRALSSLYGDTGMLSSENIRETGAEIIWLLRHQDMTDEAFRAAQADGTMTEEIEALRNSEAYSRFMSSMDTVGISNLFEEVRKSPQEGAEKVLNAMSRAENEVERRDPWAGNLYDRLMANPQELARFQDIMGRLASPEQINKP